MWAYSSKRAPSFAGSLLAFSCCLWAALPETGQCAITDSADINISDYIPTSEISPILKTVGMLTAHRPYQGASSLLGEGATGMGIDVGVEATLMGISSDLVIPGTGTPITLASLPFAKLHLSKAFGPNADVSASGIIYKDTLILGGALKLLLYQPTEGFEWAIRGGVSYTTLDLTGLTGETFPIEDEGVTLGEIGMTLKTQNYSLHLVTSKKLDFAEPYLAFGGNYTLGQMIAPVTLNAVAGTQELSGATVEKVTADAILGVLFKMPGLGLRLGIEGSFNSASMHTLGVKIGVGL